MSLLASFRHDCSASAFSRTHTGPRQRGHPALEAKKPPWLPRAGRSLSALPPRQRWSMTPDVVSPPSVPAAVSAGHARHPCLRCGYELLGLPFVGKGRTCPECGAITTDDDLRRARRLPSVWRALAWMCGVPYGGALAAWIVDMIRDSSTPPLAGHLRIVYATLLLVTFFWALIVPPIVATRRSARSGRSPLGTIDETVLGYSLNVGLPVLLLFIGLLARVILSR